MRLLVILSLLAACGSSKPSSEAPPPATSSLLDCTKVADHVGATVAAQPPRANLTPAAVEDMVRTRCQTDGWSHETKQCLYAIKAMSEGRACASGMTDVQRDAIRAHARQLRGDAPTETKPDTDWIEHVVAQ